MRIYGIHLSDLQYIIHLQHKILTRKGLKFMDYSDYANYLSRSLALNTCDMKQDGKKM